jgi:hypothetical protein
MFEIFLNEMNLENSLIMMFLLIIFLTFYVIRRHHYVVNYRPLEVTIEQTILRIPMEDRVDLVMEDKHNVHNQCLKRNAINVIKNLQIFDQHHYTMDSAFNDISQMIELSPDTNLERLESASYVLESIKNIGAFYHTAKISELEILRLLWERINHPINHECVSRLKENLIEQLADCQNDYSGVHCCEGRIMRILQTLELCDAENIVTLRPMWAYKEEISNQIIKYREKLLFKAPNKYQNLEKKTELTSEDSQLLEKFNRCLINNLNKRFEIDYISTGLLTKDEIEELTQVYYESLYDYLS